ncbi:hypothetical protein GHK86_04645 [Acidimicrobiaceae bacterium USS-CC1]|uniref:Polysaccharide chain length determinant N-terminal domain-containing protein n=1 Tax=Acidiferrimicrobium australe TaxID=2664430 RepID=A0ABW9QQM5_9ACTN|nr:hypothetical protein [Acidiferrimicrobium australe]
MSDFAASVFGPAAGGDDGSEGASPRVAAGGQATSVVAFRGEEGFVPGYWIPANSVAANALGGESGTYVSPGRSMLLHWRVVTALAVLGLLFGVLFGVVRHPTYTSTQELYVGKTLNVANTAAIAGLATAATQIAQDYAQLATTAAVTNGAEKALHVHQLPGTLAATVVSSTPEIEVIATAKSASVAQRLAGAGAQALMADVSKLNLYSQASLNSLKQQYAAVEVRISNDQSEINALRSQGVPATNPRIQSLQQDVSLGNLQAQTLSSQYANQESPYPAEESVLQSLGPARGAIGDRKKAVEIGAVAGLLIGVLLGVAVASAIDLRRRRATATARA